MTKSEKLILVLQLLKEKPGLQISEIAEYCGISQRTAYRYINSLIKMRQPLKYDNGYRLAGKGDYLPATLLPDDLALLRIAFASSPLSQSARLRNRFKALAAALNSSKSVRDEFRSRIEIVGSGIELSGCRGVQCLPTLLEALLEKRNIRLKLSGEPSKTISVRPKRIVFLRDHFSLTAEIVGTGEAAVLDSDEIESAKLV